MGLAGGSRVRLTMGRGLSILLTQHMLIFDKQGQLFHS